MTLVKNKMTNNTAIVEIKKPQTKLLRKTPIQRGVFSPSTELSGAISQVLEQKYRFERDIARIKEDSRIYDIETYSVHCCLIIGKTPSGVEHQKSFELVRRNSKDVDVVTFDELLGKLKELSQFLSPDQAKPATQIQVPESDLPF